MRVTVDKVGRVVIPKAIRVALGIDSDTGLELVPDGGGLRLDPVRSSERLITEDDGFPLLGFVPGVSLTDEASSAYGMTSYDDRGRGGPLGLRHERRHRCPRPEPRRACALPAGGDRPAASARRRTSSLGGFPRTAGSTATS